MRKIIRLQKKYLDHGKNYGMRVEKTSESIK